MTLVLLGMAAFFMVVALVVLTVYAPRRRTVITVTSAAANFQPSDEGLPLMIGDRTYLICKVNSPSQAVLREIGEQE